MKQHWKMIDKNTQNAIVFIDIGIFLVLLGTQIEELEIERQCFQYGQSIRNISILM